MCEKSSRSDSLSQIFSKKSRKIALFALGLAIVAASFITALDHHQITHAASVGDWSSYMFDSEHSGFNGAETIINPISAPHLKIQRTFQGAGEIFSQPVTANGMVYWGSSDGYERAATLNGNPVWQDDLGHIKARCGATGTIGVVGTATAASVVINGTITRVIFVGGGNDRLYALDALTGTILWSTPLGAPSSNIFIWDSSAMNNNSIYIGTASVGDCPLIAAQLFRLNAATGAVQKIFNVMPAGCLGGGIWGSPTIDQANNAVYFTTGNTTNHCSTKAKNATALVKLRATDLSFISSWQIPVSERVTDSDFGSTPTLFQTKIKGVLHQLVGAVNKNGVYYAFDRTNISGGPVWSVRIAIGGGCPECGQGSISPAAWDGTTLYVAGGETTIHGTSCLGSLRALNPVDGSFIWQRCLTDGTVLGAVTAVPGVIAIVEGHTLVLVNALSGKTLFTYPGAEFGSPSISNGVLYIGDQNGELYAFGT